MRFLHHPLYCRGGSGLSNIVMSWELGVVASFLLDRVLVIEGNVSPPANIVQYAGKGVTNRHPARIPDLMEIPVPWIELAAAPYDVASAQALATRGAAEAVFVWPPDRELDTDDFRSFARGRETVITETAETRDLPVVRMFESTPEGHEMANLGFYSYFFYLDTPTRRVVENLLHAMKPQAPYAALAAKVSRDLGRFNAVHARRGDFKGTFGTTTLDRKPAEMIRVLDRNFDRAETLVILTDERDDPFFDEVTQAFPKSVFVDHHILDHYREDFLDLPLHDSIALAYLSQLVGADAMDFVGSMTSTYTSLVQRFRGNRGRPEAFKFLWNELPDPRRPARKRGSHPPSDVVPLHPDGRLVEEGVGPYTWNRVNRLINPAWQREWPESFLSPDTGPDSVATRLRNDFHAWRRERVVAEDARREQGSPTPVSDAPAQIVDLTVHLAGGQSFRTRLPADSDVLAELFRAIALGTEGSAPGEHRLLQVPIDGGQAAYSFSSRQLVAVETCPPVLIRGDAAEEAVAPPPVAARASEAEVGAKPARRTGPVVREPAGRRQAAEAPRDFDPLPFVQVTDFLTPDEHRWLLDTALAARDRFEPVDGRALEVASALDERLAEHVARRLRLLLPNVLPAHDLKRSFTAADLRLAAHRHGDRLSGADARRAAKSEREITCVYFAHKEPRAHGGGEVQFKKGANLHLVEPRNNAVLIFPTAALDEMLELSCQSGEFADSRFTVSVRIP